MQLYITFTLGVAILLFSGCRQENKSNENDINQSSTTADLETPIDQTLQEDYFGLMSSVQNESIGTEAYTKDELRAMLIEEADTDGDGIISSAERQALKDQWADVKEKIKENLKNKFDTDGDGVISPEEKAAALANRGQELSAMILSAHDSLREARREALSRIQQECGGKKGNPEPSKNEDSDDENPDLNTNDDPEQINEDINRRMEQCRTMISDEREALKQQLIDMLAAIQEKMDELKTLRDQVDAELESEPETAE